MPTSFSVDSGRCGHKTEIATERKGTKIVVNITTTCPRVKAYAEALKEVDMRHLVNPIMTNQIYTVASSNLGPECVVPCAVVSAAWTEAGMVARSLLNKYKSTCFTYEGGSD